MKTATILQAGFFIAIAALATRASTEVTRHVLTCGGETVTSEHCAISSALGQDLVGTSISPHHEIIWGFFAFVGQPCAASAVCNDDDVCTFDKCTNTLCSFAPVQFGDVNGSGTSRGAVIPNLDDILCALSGFADFAQCPNADLTPPCTGNDLINLDDILAVLSAFAGNDPCACAG